MNFKAILITAWICFLALATAYAIDSETLQVCDSPACIQRAKILNESLNTSIDPCKDFYSYVCYDWESHHSLPSGRGSYDVYEEIRKDLPEKLSYILGNRTLVEINQTIIDKVAIMYNACLVLPDSSAALIRVLNESGFNAWPIVTEENVFNTSNCADLLGHMNISAIISVESVPMGMYAKGRANPYDMNVGPMLVQKRLKKMKDIGKVINNTIRLLNPGIESSILENLTKQLMEFERNLSAITSDYYTHTAYNISGMEAEFTNIPLSDLLKKEFTKVNITLDDADTFHVFYNYINKLIRFLDTANPNTLYNYAGFLRIFPYTQYVRMSTEEASSSELTQSTTKGRNWRECIAILHGSMSDILDYLYVTNDTNHTSIKEEVETIARRMKEAFNETLQNNGWIDNTTRDVLQKKLNRVTLQIGYPDTLLDISALEARYRYVPLFALNISFAEALYHIRENSYKMQLRKLRYPEEGALSWEHSSRYPRTFHDDYGQKIEIPYALFVSPFFQLGLPRSLNYGGIGSTIAHELVHSFSDEGTDKCQERRNLQCNISKNSFELFNNKTTCFKEQYKVANEKLLVELDDNYNENTSAEARDYEAFFALRSREEHDCCYREALEEHKRMSKLTRQTEGSGSNDDNKTEESSGTRDNATEKCLAYWREYYRKWDEYWSRQLSIHWVKTLNEDLADNIGLQTAFKAYKKAVEEDYVGQDTRLTGLESISGLQLFFISSARIQCRIADTETLVKEIRRAEYSTAQIRVNEAMKNLEGFAKAFNCSLHSPMNPNERCSLW